jgi:hypothetical protein
MADGQPETLVVGRTPTATKSLKVKPWRVFHVDRKAVSVHPIGPIDRNDLPRRIICSLADQSDDIARVMQNCKLAENAEQQHRWTKADHCHLPAFVSASNDKWSIRLRQKCSR